MFLMFKLIFADVSILGYTYRKRNALPSITIESRDSTVASILHYHACKPDTVAWFLRSPNTVALHNVAPTVTANVQLYTTVITSLDDQLLVVISISLRLTTAEVHITYFVNLFIKRLAG